MTFPTQLHAILNDPEKEKAALDLIQAECLREYAMWKDPNGGDDGFIEAGALGASANLLCRFLGLTKGE